MCGEEQEKIILKTKSRSFLIFLFLHSSTKMVLWQSKAPYQISDLYNLHLHGVDG